MVVCCCILLPRAYTRFVTTATLVTFTGLPHVYFAGRFRCTGLVTHSRAAHLPRSFYRILGRLITHYICAVTACARCRCRYHYYAACHRRSAIYIVTHPHCSCHHSYTRLVTVQVHCDCNWTALHTTPHATPRDTHTYHAGAFGDCTPTFAHYILVVTTLFTTVTLFTRTPRCTHTHTLHTRVLPGCHTRFARFTDGSHRMPLPFLPAGSLRFWFRTTVDSLGSSSAVPQLDTLVQFCLTPPPLPACCRSLPALQLSLHAVPHGTGLSTVRHRNVPYLGFGDKPHAYHST